ncbi:hypothetical protein NEOLI_001357 [Neolecta irregularis DAH-3]|uniref:Uncharacterized protein n=1 Tax=Neolecta irregularis (strain DAH-3) TaxID=1198029 RepID=A0A1U7LV42_NEOID|nr:hypothetical protein NEOLI_001357 [Neolecta irregularis DAH-3]|eukprot:OLL26540.1 hypothetical protein NEOLI_001357 [Neolecta irregularis DAH-3]
MSDEDFFSVLDSLSALNSAVSSNDFYSIIADPTDHLPDKHSSDTSSSLKSVHSSRLHSYPPPSPPSTSPTLAAPALPHIHTYSPLSPLPHSPKRPQPLLPFGLASDPCKHLPDPSVMRTSSRHNPVSSADSFDSLCYQSSNTSSLTPASINLLEETYREIDAALSSSKLDSNRGPCQRDHRLREYLTSIDDNHVGESHPPQNDPVQNKSCKNPPDGLSSIYRPALLSQHTLYSKDYKRPIEIPALSVDLGSVIPPPPSVLYTASKHPYFLRWVDHQASYFHATSITVHNLPLQAVLEDAHQLFTYAFKDTSRSVDSFRTCLMHDDVIRIFRAVMFGRSHSQPTFKGLLPTLSFGEIIASESSRIAENIVSWTGNLGYFDMEQSRWPDSRGEPCDLEAGYLLNSFSTDLDVLRELGLSALSMIFQIEIVQDISQHLTMTKTKESHVTTLRIYDGHSPMWGLYIDDSGTHDPSIQYQIAHSYFASLNLLISSHESQIWARQNRLSAEYQSRQNNSYQLGLFETRLCALEQQVFRARLAARTVWISSTVFSTIVIVLTNVQT